MTPPPPSADAQALELVTRWHYECTGLTDVPKGRPYVFYVDLVDRIAAALTAAHAAGAADMDAQWRRVGATQQGYAVRCLCTPEVDHA